ncbi:MAG TPA: MmgE/PrpD family protein [Steroidobacteraceae bacterium]|nr:MmgE/PrpD family protein [Steroidobacteraceae bacterium]
MQEVEAVTRTLASYVVNARYADVPVPVRDEALRSLVNWAGCAIGGSRHEAVNRALAAVRPFSGTPESSILGRTERIDVLNSALLNGISSHVFDFDDTHLKTIIHPAGPVASALIPLAERLPITGVELLHAFILGVEVECRIGNAVYPAHYDIGWHITGTAGVFGAAAAVGKVLGLDVQQMTWALGIAGTQSSGFREMFGTMCKSFHPGRAAQNGLLAAHLAKQNFTSSDRVLEAPRGFGFVMSADRDFSEVTKNLGEQFEISLNTYKPFACGIVIHPAIDGAIQLRNGHGLTAEMIESIKLRVAPLVLELTGKRTPRVGLEGKFSVFHSVAVAIIRGAAGESEYADDVVTDPNVIALRDRVDAHVDRGIRDDEAHVSITLKDGRVLEQHVEHALGSLERPMSNDDLERKFLRLCEGVLSAQQAQRVLANFWSADLIKDASELGRATVPV